MSNPRRYSGSAETDGSCGSRERLGSQPRNSILVETARGAGWTIGWRLLTRALGIISTLILVRLLVPDDFGLVALATGLSGGVHAFSALGIDEAVIRQKSTNGEVYDTAFTINLIRGAITALIVVSSAGFVSTFFNEPRLAPILLVLGVCIFITSFENIGTIEFRRNFRFDKEFRLLLLPRLAGIVVSIGSATIWHSYWALIGGIVTGQIITTLTGYLMHPYRPHLGLAAWRQLAGFSIWSWAISIAIMIRDRVDDFVIGKLLGIAQVGIYSVGAEIGLAPTYELAAPLSRACFSGFASAIRGDADIVPTYLRILASVMLVVLPIGTGLTLVAAPLVILAFGPAWIAATNVVRILGVSGVMLAPGLITTVLLSAHGLLRSGFFINILSMTVRAIGAFALVSFFGLAGAATAHALTIMIENGSYVVVAFRRFGVRAPDVFLLIWRGLLATAAMIAGLTLTGLGNDITSPLWSLVAAVVVGAGVYVFVLVGSWFLCGRPPGGERDLFALASQMIVYPGRPGLNWMRRGG
jgi:O-antigen/teichoic acid export membrane protein